ncbi:hypothetical protein SESBI_07296 [Sesbania bispinosa]|nr:hypothetical protein SESBI_07296 [Sesbania bispinosa]
MLWIKSREDALRRLKSNKEERQSQWRVSENVQMARIGSLHEWKNSRSRVKDASSQKITGRSWKTQGKTGLIANPVKQIWHYIVPRRVNHDRSKKEADTPTIWQ